jgi:hypothetical protein
MALESCAAWNKEISLGVLPSTPTILSAYDYPNSQSVKNGVWVFINMDGAGIVATISNGPQHDHYFYNRRQYAAESVF